MDEGLQLRALLLESLQPLGVQHVEAAIDRSRMALSYCSFMHAFTAAYEHRGSE
jgi:hypothetical protein